MRVFKTKAGPFAERPYYPDADIEAICTDELAKLNLLPNQPQPIRIDRFIERRFVTPSYMDLGEGILGLTKFSANGVAEIIVSTRLDAEGSKISERRVRTTLAHEGGHGLLHAHLFALESDKPALFGDFSDPAKPKVLCRDEKNSGHEYCGDWWEVQANKAMSCLLMPKRLVDAAIAPYLTPQGRLGLKALAQSDKQRAVRELSDVFDVNPVVVRLRIEQLYPETGGGQLTL
jgi:hypothetical protein